MPRQIYWSASDAEQSSTTGWADAQTLTFTPDSNKAYVVIFTWCARNNSSFSASAEFRCLDGSSNQVHFLQYSGRNDNYYACGALYFYPSTASPTSQTVKIQMRHTGSAAGRGKFFRILAIRLEADDQYSETTGQQLRNSGTFATRATVTNSASGTNDFLIIGSCRFYHSTAGSCEGKARLTGNGTAYQVAQVGDGGAIGQQNYFGMWPVSLANGQTATLDYASSNGNDLYINDARVCILKLSNFDAVLQSTQQTRQTRTSTGSTSYGSAFSYSPTLVAADYVIIGTAMQDYSNTGAAGGAQFVSGGTTLAESLLRPRDTAVIESAVAIEKITATAGSRTLDWQHKTASTSDTSGLDEMCIVALQVSAAAGNTYNVSLSMGSTAAMTQGAAMSMNPALSMAAAASMAQGGPAEFGKALSMPATAGLTLQNALAADLLLQLAASPVMQQAAGVAVARDISLAASLSISPQAALNAVGALPLAAVATMTPAALLDAATQILMASGAGMSLLTQIAAEKSLSLAATAAMTASTGDGQVYTSSLVMQVTAEMNLAAAQMVTGIVTMAVNAALSQTSQAGLVAGVSLPVSAAFSQTSQANLIASLDFPALMDMARLARNDIASALTLAVATQLAALGDIAADEGTIDFLVSASRYLSPGYTTAYSFRTETRYIA